MLNRLRKSGSFQLYGKQRPGKTALFCVLVFFSFGAVGGAAEPPITLPDAKEKIIVGISIFSGSGLGRESEYLTMNIPTLIREQLRQFPYHYLSQREQTEYRQRLREAAEEKRRKEMAALFRERDKLFLSAEVSEEQEEQFQQKMADLRGEIEAITALRDSELPIAEKKPIELYTHGENGGLLPADRISAAAVSSRFQLDFYISGRVEQISDYFYIQVALYSSIVEEEVLLIEDAGSRENLEEVIDRVVRGTYDVIVGEEWAFLQVTALPEDADIYLDGGFIGSGTVENVYLQPGDHTVSAEAAGYGRLEQEITVSPGETESVRMQLQPVREDTLLISSDPPRADVYSGPIWLGTTPLLLPLREEKLQRIMVVKRDFSPEYLNAGPGDKGSVNVRLSPFAFDSSAYLDKKRDEFYLSAGFFVLSFPIPFFLYSITEDLASGFSIAAAAGNVEEMEKKLRGSMAAYHGYVGSIIVTASMLLNTIFRLAEYIRASELD